VARDENPPGRGAQSSRGGASGRKRGTAHLTLVPDLEDEDAGRNPPAVGSALEDSGAADSDGNPGVGRNAVGAGLGGMELGSEEAARAICLRLLTGGPRTRAQLATALRKRKISDEVAEAVLSRFTEVGLIDDAAFARAWVESRHHGRGLARRALSAELRQRGIPDGEVRSAVGLLGPQDELATAQRLVAKRLPASRGKPMPARARQLMGMLARKGYSSGLATQVVREALEQEQENDAGYRADLAWISEDGAGDD
jgi:regulatory protein